MRVDPIPESLSRGDLPLSFPTILSTSLFGVWLSVEVLGQFQL